MMVVLQVISTSCGNDVEVVMSSRPTLAGGYAGTVKLIVGIVHLVDAEDSLQATLVKCLVVSDQWQSLYERLYLLPYFGKYRCILRVFSTQTMHLAAPVIIILRLGLDEGIELIHYLPIPHYHYTN